MGHLTIIMINIFQSNLIFVGINSLIFFFEYFWSTSNIIIWHCVGNNGCESPKINHLRSLKVRAEWPFWPRFIHTQCNQTRSWARDSSDSRQLLYTKRYLFSGYLSRVARKYWRAVRMCCVMDGTWCVNNIPETQVDSWIGRRSRSTWMNGVVLFEATCWS